MAGWNIREDPISFLVASRTPPLEDSCRVPQPATSGTFSVFPMSHVRNRRQASPHPRARELHAFPRLRSGPLLSRGSSPPARKSVVWGKSVAVRVNLGGGRNIKKKKKEENT